MTVALIFACIVLGGLAVCAFGIAHAERKERYKTEQEAQKHEQNTADAITEAREIKAQANTGDNRRDFAYMADKLREYAEK